jgi:hypothetical protein
MTVEESVSHCVAAWPDQRIICERIAAALRAAAAEARMQMGELAAQHVEAHIGNGWEGPADIPLKAAAAGIRALASSPSATRPGLMTCDCGLMVETHTTLTGKSREHKLTCASLQPSATRPEGEG